MPYAVESAHYGCDGSEECIAHPYGQYGVFLSERLSGGDFLAVAFPDLSSEPELQGAADKRYGDKPQLSGEGYLAVYDASGCDCESQSQSDSPQVERQFLIFAKAFGYMRREPSQKHCGDKRQEEQREDFAENK